MLPEEQTTQKPIKDPFECQDCKIEAPDGWEVDYLIFSSYGEYTSPSKREKRKVCDNCVDVYY